MTVRLINEVTAVKVPLWIDGGPRFCVTKDLITYYALYWGRIESAGTAPIPILSSSQRALRQVLSILSVEQPITVDPAGVNSRWSDAAHQLHEWNQLKNISKLHEMFDQKRRYIYSGQKKRPGAIVGIGSSCILALLRALRENRDLFLYSEHRDFNLSALDTDEQSLYIFTEDLGEEIILKHQELASKRTQPLRLGYCHGLSFEAMTFLDAKQAAWAEKNVELPSLIVGVNDSSRAKEDPRKKLKQVSSLALSRDFHEGCWWNTIAITGHGMSDLIHLNADFICGRNPRLAELAFKDVGGPWPACMSPPFKCWKTTGKALFAHELPGLHVLLNSCGSLKFKKSDFNPLFNIPYSLIEGAAISVVGSIRWKDGGGNESALYTAAIEAGFTLGDVLFFLNQALISNQYESDDRVFFLIGDPAYRDPNAQPPVLIQHWRDDLILKGYLDVFRVRNREWVAAFLRRELLLEIPRYEGYVSVINEFGCDDTLLFLFYRSTKEEQVIAPLVHATYQPYSDAVSAYLKIFRNLDSISGISKVYPHDLQKGQKTNLDNAIKNVARLFRSALQSPDSFRKLKNSCAEFLAKVAGFDQEILDQLLESVRRKEFRFSEHYHDVFLLSAEALPLTPCYLCGLPVEKRLSKHMVLPDLRRYEYVCPSCGGLEDKPRDDISLTIAPENDCVQVGPNVFQVVLTITNKSDSRISGVAGMGLRKSADWPVQVEPKSIRCLVEPGASQAHSFAMQLLSGTRLHQLVIQGILVCQTDVYLSSRPLWTTEGSADNSNLPIEPLKE